MKSTNSFYKGLSLVLIIVVAILLWNMNSLNSSNLEWSMENKVKAEAGTTITNTENTNTANTEFTFGSNTIVEIAKKVGPAVVGVSNKVKVPGYSRMFSEEEEEQGTGSGIIFDERGYIITNNHVVEGADELTVTLAGGKEVPAELVGRDSVTDLAVIKIDESNLTVAPLGDSSKVQTGESVIAIGNPLGLELAGSVTAGIISGVRNEMVIDGKKMNLLQTDAAINPGNSGGALVNAKGEVIGINTLKETFAGSNNGMPISAEGIGFAIPINDAMPIIEQLMKDGKISRPALGIIASEINQDYAKAYKRQYGQSIPTGILVRGVVNNGPADKAGLQPGDIITQFNGAELETFQQLSDILQNSKIGSKVQLTIWRDGKEMTVQVVLEDTQN